jgi:prevent-host-death family protein
MKSVGVKQLKTRLSEYLRSVRRGETILVTDRGEVVAELRPARPRPTAASLDEILEALSERGEITRAAIRKGRWTWKYKGLGLPSGTAAELLDDIRSDRY